MSFRKKSQHRNQKKADFNEQRLILAVEHGNVELTRECLENVPEKEKPEILNKVYEENNMGLLHKATR